MDVYTYYAQIPSGTREMYPLIGCITRVVSVLYMLCIYSALIAFSVLLAHISGPYEMGAG